MTGSKIVLSIKNIVREICISSCKGKCPDRDNGKLFFLKSQRGSLQVQWKQYKLSECLTVILRGRAGYELIYITNEAVDRVGYYRLISGKSEKNNCFSKFSSNSLDFFG